MGTSRQKAAPPPVPQIPDKYSSPGRMSQAQRIRDEVLAQAQSQAQSQSGASSAGTSPSQAATSSTTAPSSSAATAGTGGGSAPPSSFQAPTPRRPSTSSSVPSLGSSLSGSTSGPGARRRPSVSPARPSTSSASSRPSTTTVTNHNHGNGNGNGNGSGAGVGAPRPSTSSDKSVEQQLRDMVALYPAPRTSGDRKRSVDVHPSSSASGSAPASASALARARSSSRDGRRRSMSVSDLDWQTFLRETASGLSVSPAKPASGLTATSTSTSASTASSAGAFGTTSTGGLTHTHTLPSLSINTSASAQAHAQAHVARARPAPLGPGSGSSSSAPASSPDAEAMSVPSTARTGSFMTATEGHECVPSGGEGRASVAGSGSARDKGRLSVLTASGSGYGSAEGRDSTDGRESVHSQASAGAGGAVGGRALELPRAGEEEGARTPTSATTATGSAGTGTTAMAGRASEDATLLPEGKKRVPMPPRTTSAPSPGSATTSVSTVTASSASTSATTPSRLLPVPPAAASSKSIPLPAGGPPAAGPAFLLSPSSPTPSAYAVPHHRSASASAPSLAIYPAHAHPALGLGVDAPAPAGAAGTSPANSTLEGMESRAWELARKCWDEEQGWIGRERMAEWLGGVGAINKAALKHYMDFFDFSSLRLDQAFRRLCAKLYLKAETQQLDRILDQFARRYWECNPATIYGSASVVHAIAYSLLLLNTDLHIAELSSHMSRREFVRNTMETVWAQLRPEQRDNAPISPASVTSGPPVVISRTPGGSVSMDIPRTSLSSPVEEGETEIPPVKHQRDRSGSLTSWKDKLQRSDTAPMLSMMGTEKKEHAHIASVSVPVLRKSESEMSMDEAATAAVAAHKAGAQDYGKGWEGDMESLLKDMFNSVKTQQILQPIANMSASSTNLSSAMRRPSVRTPGNLKRGSIRGLHQLLSASGPQSPYSSAGGSSSSIDGRLSPAPSFATSETNFGSGSTLFTPTLGFASNLSHSIIKESLGEDSDGHRSGRGLSTAGGKRDLASHSTASLVSQGQESNDDGELSDEELALLGPPWAKEGMLCRKQYWESAGKRAKNKDWKDVFVVIQKGELSMFVFGEGSSTRAGAGVGGGNWLSNAQQVGSVTLAHSLAHVLPPPGYNRQRPHCFVLTLSDGAVYFFQAGTEDLVNEWVSTCNYWAARLSKEPLQGGVSNMEYGWNRVIPGSSAYAVEQRADTLSIKSSSMSLRIGNSPYADRTLIAEWKTPMAPSIPSTLDEETQLESLQKHVKTLQNDLDAHTQLKQPMLQLYTPRSTPYARALANWEKKSQYLLSEVVKYTSYVESLRNAMSLRLKKQGEKTMERALNKGSTAIVDLVSPSSASASSANTAAPGPSRKASSAPVDTIQELPEPVTPAKSEFHGSNSGHKKDVEAEP
ncbi:hypothetical protein CALCODRAFT_497760 [Calocera cornea HHB12733]|uniref:SEC7 domain-containing protein n=1 Tax=Calocera cornea HHB12733 TaxID=1353952 RepID=A0A165F4Q1_9BASI|nr:hypothetical protein CALCODRAFT_497760 [Calocera cornea HHB12733]